MEGNSNHKYAFGGNIFAKYVVKGLMNPLTLRIPFPCVSMSFKMKGKCMKQNMKLFFV